MSQKFILHAGDPERMRILANCAEFMRKLPPLKSWEVCIAPHVRTRTPKQRKALFAAAYKPLMEFMGLRGEDDKNTLHAFFCCEFFGRHPQLPNKPLRTTTKNERGERDEMSTREALEFYAFIQQRAAEQGIYVPDPDPFWREQREAA